MQYKLCNRFHKTEALVRTKNNEIGASKVNRALKKLCSMPDCKCNKVDDIEGADSWDFGYYGEIWVR